MAPPRVQADIGRHYGERRTWTCTTCPTTPPIAAEGQGFAEPVEDATDARASLGLEGMVARRRDSPYRRGVRADDWLKVKTAGWRAVHAPRRIDARR
jgi:hypothetical protein